MTLHRSRIASRRGSALLTVVMLTGMMALLTASMLQYTIAERRGNERNRLILQAKNMSENISLYAAEQITTKLYRLRSASTMAFLTGTNRIYLPPTNILNSADPAYTASSTSMEVLAGITGSTGLVYINPATSPNDPNAGLSVNTAAVPIIAKATAVHPIIGNIAAYSQNDLAVDFIPLFQFAVFYNMDLEIWPGADLTLAGPVHCNGELSARSATGFAAILQFTDRVSSSGGFYADSIRQGTWINNTGGTDAGPGGTGGLRFQNPAGTVTDIRSGTGVYRDHKYGSATETTTTKNNFKVFASATYSLNLRTSVHGVTSLVLPSISDYKKTDDAATTEDERDNGRQLIEAPDPADTAGLKETKMARRCGLYIIVNPDANSRTGRLPNGTAVSMRARSYRAWLNTVNADLSHTINEVILPGQPSYGTLNANVNNLPNAYRTDTSIGINQVLRMIQGSAPDLAGTGYTVGAAPTLASFSDAYFYDLRRAKNNAGAVSMLSSGSFRSGNNYTPRPIVKVDFDMARFRMAVERTISGTPNNFAASDVASTIYDPSMPNASTWGSSIYNSAATPAARGLGLGASFNVFPTATTLPAPDPFRLYFAPSNPADPLIATDPGRFAVGAADLVSTVTTRPWFDGITIFVHSVDAEVRGDANVDGLPDRIDSGVRLWHGRGQIVSLDGTTYPGRTGLTFVTNDAAYIIGHYNADGTINATTTSTANPGGFSAAYPDTATERLTATMADAITILSQPEFTNTTFVQSTGWSDSLSANATGAASASWNSTQPSGSNGFEGTQTSLRPAALPFLGNTVAGAGALRTTKFGGNETEISTCLLVGQVPTNHNPTGLTDGPPSTGANGQASGGLHNFPRMLENWSGQGLYIRGSMVAMFESRVAMESWTLRVYSAPGRYWGLHQSLRNANHDLPLEPILLGARRLGFKEINAAQYTAQKAIIEALPH